MLSYWCFKGLGLLSSVLPRSVQYRASAVAARLYHRLDGRAREAVRANLRVMLGSSASEAAIRREAARSFRSFGRYLCEFFGYRRFGPDYFDQHVTILGRENLDRALATGRGALFVSGHYSNWELGASVVGHMGYPILIVAQMHRDPKVNELFVSQRAKHGVTVAHSEQGALAALRALRENRPVAILGDRPTGGPTVPVKLFGRPMDFPQGPWRIALATGAPILPTFVHRRCDGDYVLDIGAPVTPPAAGSREARIAAYAQAWAEQFETRVRTDPSQWAAFYPVWQTAKTRGTAHKNAPGQMEATV